MVPEVLVLDYDRTLASVDLPNERLLKLVDAAGLPVSSEDIREARRDAESQHQSFATYEYLSQRLQETADPHDTTQAWRRQLTRIYRQFFLNSDSEELLFYDDAVHFFDRVKRGNKPHFLMTYGTEDWQRLKVESSGYSGGVLITPTAKKSDYMRAMRHDDPESPYCFKADMVHSVTYTVAQQLCLIDDKPKAFDDMPEDCRGFCIRRPDLTPLTPEERDRLPSSVEVISTLDELDTDPETGLLMRVDPATVVRRALQRKDVIESVFDTDMSDIIRPIFPDTWPDNVQRPIVTFSVFLGHITAKQNELF